MTENNIDLDGGFSTVAGLLSSNKSKDNYDYDNPNIPVKDPEEFEEEEVEEEVKPSKKKKDEGQSDKSEKGDKTKDEEETDESDEHDESDDASDVQGREDEEEVTLSEEDLPEIINFFVDEFSKELGWELKDDEKPKNMKELVNYMQSIIDENSQPHYPSEDVQALAEFVEKGGDLKEFYDKVYGTIDVDKIDIDSVPNQKKVIRENLKSRGYSDIKIDKLVNRYEEAGTLEEEAQDALELLKEYKKETAEKLLDEQQKIFKQQEKQKQEFITNVQNSIKKAESIRGIPLSDKDKKDLIRYIFEIGNEGKTKYQLDYEKSHLNLIESAYFTMKGDSFVQQVQKKATSEAAKNLKLKLKAKGKVNKNTADDAEDNKNRYSFWDEVSSHLSKGQ